MGKTITLAMWVHWFFENPDAKTPDDDEMGKLLSALDRLPLLLKKVQSENPDEDEFVEGLPNPSGVPSTGFTDQA